MQTITTPGGEKLVVLSEGEYEDLIDTRDAIAAEHDLTSGRTDLFSEAEMSAYLAAPSPLAFWRNWRGVAAAELARDAGISEQYLGDLEAGQAIADVRTYARLARRLRTRIESLLPKETRSSEAVAAQ